MMNDDLVNRCIAILGTRGPDPTISRDDLDELLSGYQHWHIYGPTATAEKPSQAIQTRRLTESSEDG